MLHNLRDFGFGKSSMDGLITHEVNELCSLFKQRVQDTGNELEMDIAAREQEYFSPEETSLLEAVVASAVQLRGAKGKRGTGSDVPRAIGSASSSAAVSAGITFVLRGSVSGDEDHDSGT